MYTCMCVCVRVSECACPRHKYHCVPVLLGQRGLGYREKGAQQSACPQMHTHHLYPLCAGVALPPRVLGIAPCHTGGDHRLSFCKLGMAIQVQGGTRGEFLRCVHTPCACTVWHLAGSWSKGCAPPDGENHPERFQLPQSLLAQHPMAN